jgi:hypothetical protein
VENRSAGKPCLRVGPVSQNSFLGTSAYTERGKQREILARKIESNSIGSSLNLKQQLSQE